MSNTAQQNETDRLADDLARLQEQVESAARSANQNLVAARMLSVVIIIGLVIYLSAGFNRFDAFTPAQTAQTMREQIEMELPAVRARLAQQLEQRAGHVVRAGMQALLSLPQQASRGAADALAQDAASHFDAFERRFERRAAEIIERRQPGEGEPFNAQAWAALRDPLLAAFEEEGERLVEQLGELVDEHHLEKTFKFKDFKSALDFVNKVGAIAEAQNHHPDMELGWGRAKVSIHTHKIDGLTESDFVFAAKAEQAAA